MTDVAVPYDVDPTADMFLDFEERVVGANTVRVPKTVLVDGVTNNKAEVLADRSQSVTVKSPANGVDAHSRGAGGSGTSVPVGTSDSPLLAVGTTRRAVWFTNNGANAVWITPGGAAAAVGSGVILYPGAVINFDASPNAAFHAISTGGTVLVAIGIESD